VSGSEGKGVGEGKGEGGGECQRNGKLHLRAMEMTTTVLESLGG